METGNEGDNITLYALRQSDCDIPKEVISLGQVTADILVNIVGRSIFLITDGTTNFPLPLPKNIPSRHRICTDIATKIKGLGFTGECGYNQLLYPSESQTRALLTWLVQKLPRTEEEPVAILGADALLNQRIRGALTNWKEALWRLPFCSTGNGKASRNFYHKQRYATLSRAAVAADIYVEALTVKEIFALSMEHGVSPVCTLLERSTRRMLHDGTLAGLKDDFAEFDLQDPSTSISVAESTAGQDANGKSQKIQINDFSLSLYSKSFGELVKSIRAHASQAEPALDISLATDNDEANTATTINGTGVTASNLSQGLAAAGSRFAQAAKFSQETLSHKVTAASMVKIGIGNSSNGGSFGSVAPLFASDTASTPTCTAPQGLQVANTPDEEDQALTSSLEAASCAVEELTKQVDEQRQEVAQAQAEQQMRQARAQRYREEAVSLAERMKEVQAEVTAKQSVLQVIAIPAADAREHANKLQELCIQGTARLQQLEREWEAHRSPLIAKVTELEQRLSARRVQCQAKVDAIRRYRADMPAMLQDLRDKQARAQQLVEEQNRLNRNINRSVYTQRILDIIAAIDKQNKEVQKVCKDIHSLQKSITQTTSALQRADAVAEELIYSAAHSATGDKSLVAVYKQLCELRSTFETLVGVTDGIATSERLRHELEQRLDQERGRVSSVSAEQVRADLRLVKDENAELIEKLKKLTISK